MTRPTVLTRLDHLRLGKPAPRHEAPRGRGRNQGRGRGGGRGHPLSWRALGVFTAAMVSVSGIAAPATAAARAAGPKWGRAIEILPPSNAAPNPHAQLFGVGCPVPGSCVAGGGYTDSLGDARAVIVTESKGRWTRERALRMPPNTPVNPKAEVISVACPAAGSCVAVGNLVFGPGSGSLQGFIATQSRGRWARAFMPSLPPNAAPTPSAILSAVACAAAGFCVATGVYIDSGSNQQMMVLTESHGRWGRAREVRSPANARSNPGALARGVSCRRTGSCVAVGGYVDSSGRLQALVAAESKGRWGRAAEVALPGNAFSSPGAGLNSVTCTSPGSCVAVGTYQASSGQVEAMTATQSKGRWERAAEVRPPAGAGTGPRVILDSVSCTGPGACTAVGGAISTSGLALAITVTETGGRWGRAGVLAAPRNRGPAHPGALLQSVACVRQGHCVAVGLYTDTTGNIQAMAVTRSAPAAGVPASSSAPSGSGQPAGSLGQRPAVNACKLARPSIRQPRACLAEAVRR